MNIINTIKSESFDTAIDDIFDNLDRQFIDFDKNLDRQLNKVKVFSKGSDKHPFYNIVKIDKTNWKIEIALAGYRKEDITIEEKDGYVIVSGSATSTNTTHYVHHGISCRSFKKAFRLGEWMHVNGASMENGILTVALELVVPEEKKPKVFDIK